MQRNQRETAVHSVLLLLLLQLSAKMHLDACELVCRWVHAATLVCICRWLDQLAYARYRMDEINKLTCTYSGMPAIRQPD